MIKNRLAELLAQRQLKITKVAKDTGISRNTITATVQNDGTMIKLETIDILCNYLGVTPSEFFEFLPVLFDIDIMVTSFELDYHRDSFYAFAGFDFITYTSDIFLDITYQGKDYSFSLECRGSYTQSNADKVILNVNFANKQELEIYQNISTEISSYMFSSKIANTLSDLLAEDFKKQLMSYEDESLNEVDRQFFSDFHEITVELSELHSLKF